MSMLLMGCGSAGAWTPAQLAGLAAWYTAGPTWCFTDAGAATPCADTDPIYTWVDRSGNGRNAVQATLANRPLFRTGVQNGLPVVRSDGSNDFMDLAGTVQPVSCFAVVKQSVNQLGRVLWVLGGNNAVQQSGASTWAARFNAASNTTIAATDSAFHVVYAQSGTDGATGYDGADAPLGSVGAWISGSYVLCGNQSTQSLAGDLAELLLFTTALNATQRQQVAAYLKAQWGTP